MFRLNYSIQKIKTHFYLKKYLTLIFIVAIEFISNKKDKKFKKIDKNLIKLALFNHEFCSQISYIIIIIIEFNSAALGR